MACQSKSQIRDLVNKSCVEKNTKRGKELSFLINICDDYPGIHKKCEEINTLYNNPFSKIKKNIKKFVIPVGILIAYNLILIIVLSNPKVSSKIASYIYKKLLSSNKDVADVENIIVTFNKVYDFVKTHSILAPSVFAFSEPDKVMKAMATENMTETLLSSIPGGWIESPSESFLSYKQSTSVIDTIFSKR
jgi:hypothetical protein